VYSPWPDRHKGARQGRRTARPTRAGRARVFPFEGGPEGRPGIAKFQVSGMDRSNFDKMGDEQVPPPFGKDRHRVLLSFPVPDRDLTAIRIVLAHS
jgi:hypothetical protein